MNSTETLALTRLVKALCPSQKLDEMTPDAWALVLDDIRYEDAKIAIRNVYRNQGDDREWTRKIEADDILREVRRNRNAIIEAAADPIPPSGLTPAETLTWLRDARRSIADGRPPSPVILAMPHRELRLGDVLTARNLNSSGSRA